MLTETASTTTPWLDANLDEQLMQYATAFFLSHCYLEREDLQKHPHFPVTEVLSPDWCGVVHSTDTIAPRISVSNHASASWNSEDPRL